jgi:hypothetical protein
MILATALSLAGSLGANGESLRAMRAPPGAMPAFEAVTIARSMGLDPLSGPVWQNGSYVLRATDEDGREMRVVVDGRDGRVLAVRPIARRYFAPVAPGYGPRLVPDFEMPGFDIVRGPAFDVDFPPASDRAYPQPRSAALERSRAAAAGEESRQRAVRPQQSARLPATASPPLPVSRPEAAKKLESTEQSVQADQATSIPGGSTRSTSGPIRKIEIHRTPQEPTTGNADAPAASLDKASDNTAAGDGDTSTFGFPINPLL